MARFNFRLQGILNIKQKLEEQEKIAFGQARMLLNAEEQKLQDLYNHKDELTRIKAKLMSDRIIPSELNLYENAISGTDLSIEDQIIAVQKARKEMENARKKLDDAMKERKTYERLREKAFDQFVADQNYEEQLEINELVSYRHGRT